jgi:hypothetical protein
MTDRAAYFVVQRLYGREVPAIYWDELPKAPLRALGYVVRLDTFPNGAQLVKASIADLFAVYQMLKLKGKLPPQWEPPKPKRPSAAPSVGSD